MEGVGGLLQPRLQPVLRRQEVAPMDGLHRGHLRDQPRITD
jgi:hypothetical protein